MFLNQKKKCYWKVILAIFLNKLDVSRPKVKMLLLLNCLPCASTLLSQQHHYATVHLLDKSSRQSVPSWIVIWCVNVFSSSYKLTALVWVNFLGNPTIRLKLHPSNHEIPSKIMRGGVLDGQNQANIINGQPLQDLILTSQLHKAKKNSCYSVLLHELESKKHYIF